MTTIPLRLSVNEPFEFSISSEVVIKAEWNTNVTKIWRFKAKTENNYESEEKLFEKIMVKYQFIVHI